MTAAVPAPDLPPAVRAVAVTAPRTVSLIDVPFNNAPLAPHEVAGPTLATLVSPGTEVNANFLNGPPEAKPVVGGYAAVFRIAAVGANVQGLAPGDRVFAMGGHRAWQRHPAANCVPLPPNLAVPDALFARLACVSWSSLTTTRARPRARVLVMGLGPVGNLAAQLFQSSGYRVTAVDPAPSRRDIAAAVGVLDVRPAAPSGDQVKGLAGYHLALDCSGHEQAVLDACRAVRRGGEVVLIGTPWKRRTDLLAHELLHLVFHNYIHLRSGWEWEVPFEDREFAASSILANLRSAVEYIAEGRIRVQNLADIRSPAQALAAYEAAAAQSGSRLSTVFDWTAL